MRKVESVSNWWAGELSRHEGEAPGGAGENVARVERCFVNCGEFGGLGTELTEESFAFGECGGEVGSANGLSAGGASEEKGIGEVGDDSREVVLGGFAGVEGEEAGDGSFGFEHSDLLELWASQCGSAGWDPESDKPSARSRSEPKGTLVLYQI